MAGYAALPSVNQGMEDKGVVSLAERIQNLNLTDEQESKIAEIRKDYRPE
jgi:hypothetical protein